MEGRFVDTARSVSPASKHIHSIRISTNLKRYSIALEDVRQDNIESVLRPTIPANHTIRLVHFEGKTTT